MKTTTVFDRFVKGQAGKRFAVLQGGTSSSKTYSVLQWLIVLASQSNIPLIISIVSETFPHLKRGAMRDFFVIIGTAYLPSQHNKTDSIYHIHKSKIEFFSTEDEGKVRGPRRDILFINEANNIHKGTYDQLEIRTRKKIYIDFNPVSEFWAHEYANREDAFFDISTYKDNDLLEPAIIRSIESRRETDPNWWRVYGEGQIGQIEGLVFPYFEQIDRMPDLPGRYGIDFGYTNDPTTIVNTIVTNEVIYFDELHYQRGMQNQDIARRLKQLEIKNSEIIYADCAEPKSIDAIHAHGFNIKPSIKGKDSINAGIDFIKQYRIKVTKRSTNMIKEFRNYRYDQDKDGKLVNKPIDLFNHCIDAARYSISDKIKRSTTIKMHRMRF